MLRFNLPAEEGRLHTEGSKHFMEQHTAMCAIFGTGK